MKPFIVKRPARIVFQRGCVSRTQVASEEIKGFNTVKRIMLIGSRRGLTTAEAIKLKQELGDVVVGVIEAIEEHVPESCVSAAASRIQALDVDTILAFGGGSPLGLAKAIVPTLPSSITIISIPTTFSGSEVTAIYGVSRSGINEKDGTTKVMKVASRDERVRPSLVIYDSTLFRSLPLKKMIPSIFNALAHAVEALWAPNVGPHSSMGALESIKVVLRWLPILKDNLEDGGIEQLVEEALDNLLYSAYLAGSALDQEEMALQHRLAHVLGGSYHLPHAETHMTILPHVIYYNRKVLPAEVGLQLVTDDVAGVSYEIQTKMLGKPPSLAQLGFSRSDIEGAVDTLLSISTASNPVPLDKAALCELVQRAWKGERPPPPGAIEFTKETSVLATLGHLHACPDPRLKEVLGILIKHMHEAIRAANVTDAEWAKGIKFLTKVGQKCTATRQEFVLLSDVLGISALVNALAEEEDEEEEGPLTSTPSSLLGPFHLAGAQVITNGQDLFEGPLSSDQQAILVKGRVLSATTGQPIPQAVLDVWHSDHHGHYDIQPGFDEQASHLGFRAKVITDEKGQWSFRTILPRFYPVPDDGPVGQLLAAINHHSFRPAHCHFIICARGYKPLITTLYFADDPYVQDDVVFGSSKLYLINSLDKSNPKADPVLAQDFVICPSSEFDSLDPLHFVPEGSASHFEENQSSSSSAASSVSPPTMGPSRVPYLTDKAFLLKDKETAEGIMKRRKGKLLNLDRVLMHAPMVAKGWNGMFGVLRTGLSLDGRLRELVILRVAVMNQAYYEFYQHYEVFLQEGGLPKEAAALGRWRDVTEVFNEKDQAVLAYVDEMTRNVHVADEVAKEARAVLDSDDRLVELTALCAGYNMVARFLEALKLKPETQEDLPTMPKEGSL